jgi:hypothetical protein
MATVNTFELMNREAADKLLDETMRNPKSPYAGKFIGIANGKVMVVSDDWVAASRRLREVEPNAANTFFLEIDRDGREVHVVGPLPRPCMSSTTSGSRGLSAVEKLNRDLGDKVIAEARQKPHAYPGKFVGIANGKVVVVTDDLDELGRRLEQADSDSARTFWIELGRDYTQVHEIWRIS